MTTAYDDADAGGATAPIMNPRAVIFEVQAGPLEYDADAADETDAVATIGAAAGGAMIRATVAFAPGVDPLDLDGVGIRVPTDALLPLPVWPLDGPIVLPEGTVAPYVAPRARPTFKKGLPRGLQALPPIPSAATVGPPLAPEAFVTWLFGRLPRQGAIEPIAPGHPAFQRVATAAREGLASSRGLNPGVSDDVWWALLTHDVEHVVRRCALPTDAALAVLRPKHATLSDDDLRARIVAAQAAGLCTSDRRDTVLADFDLEAEAERKRLARDAAERQRRHEKIDVDLAASGLALFESSEHNPWGARAIFRSGALPIGDLAIHVGFLAHGSVKIARAQVRSIGTAPMTRVERDQAGHFSDDVARAIFEQREREAGNRRYSSADFRGDHRTPGGRAALVAFRARAATLIHALASYNARGPLPVGTGNLLLTLGVAFGEAAPSLAVQIDSIQEALRAYVFASSQRTVQGRNRAVADAYDASAPWPIGLVTPESVPKSVVSTLAKGSLWRWGELAATTPPAEIDPGAFDRVVADAIAGADMVTSRSVYDRLHAEGLAATSTPSPADRARVSTALGALGFVQGEATLDGVRGRVWRRQVAA